MLFASILGTIAGALIITGLLSRLCKSILLHKGVKEWESALVSFFLTVTVTVGIAAFNIRLPAALVYIPFAVLWLVGDLVLASSFLKSADDGETPAVADEESQQVKRTRLGRILHGRFENLSPWFILVGGITFLGVAIVFAHIDSLVHTARGTFLLCTIVALALAGIVSFFVAFIPFVAWLGSRLAARGHRS